MSPLVSCKKTATPPQPDDNVNDVFLKVIQSSPKFETRAVKSLPAVNLPALSKRDSADTIDAINLNIPGDEGVTMTFVETTDDEDDDEAQEVVASE